MVWLSGLSAGLWTKESPCQGTHLGCGPIPSRGCMRDNHILMFLCLSFSFPSSLSKNKINKIFKKQREKKTLIEGVHSEGIYSEIQRKLHRLIINAKFYQNVNLWTILCHLPTYKHKLAHFRLILSTILY